MNFLDLLDKKLEGESKRFFSHPEYILAPETWEEAERLASLQHTPDQIHDALINPNDRFKSIKNPKQARYVVQKKAKRDRNFEPALTIADEIAIGNVQSSIHDNFSTLCIFISQIATIPRGI